MGKCDTYWTKSLDMMAKLKEAHRQRGGEREECKWQGDPSGCEISQQSKPV